MNPRPPPFQRKTKKKQLGLGLLVDINTDFLQSKAKSNRKVFYAVEQLKLKPEPL